jgi:hypothetical protein
MPAKQSDRMRREMSGTNLGTMIDFYDADRGRPKRLLSLTCFYR